MYSLCLFARLSRHLVIFFTYLEMSYSFNICFSLTTEKLDISFVAREAILTLSLVVFKSGLLITCYLICFGFCDSYTTIGFRRF